MAQGSDPAMIEMESSSAPSGDARCSDAPELEQRIIEAQCWEFAGPDFAAQVAHGAVAACFQPQQVIFSFGEPVIPLQSPYYVVLEGKVIEEDELGVPVGQFKAGDIFGIGGALGIIENRVSTVRCSKNSRCVCARLDAQVLESALRSNPHCRAPLEVIYSQRWTKREKFQEARRSWIETTVMPALQKAPLLRGCPEDILRPIAEPLCEITFAPGKMIATAGEAADAMLLIVEGEAEVLATSGEQLGCFKDGASFGDVTALGLFGTRTVSVRALSRCRVLKVTAKVLQRAEPAREAVRILVESRKEQVRQGLPLTALPLNLRPNDAGVLSLAMQAERVDLRAGDMWETAGESDPCGLHYLVLAHGRAQLELEDRFVVHFVPGALVLEGVVAEYGAKIRAHTKCEFYRFREVDLLALGPAAKDWFDRFRLLEHNTRKHVSARLLSCRNAERVSAEHPSDGHIHDWKVRREKALDRASRMKQERAQACGPCKLPQLPQFRAPTLDEHRLLYVKGRLDNVAIKGLDNIIKGRTRMSKAFSEPQLANLPRLCKQPKRQALADWRD